MKPAAPLFYGVLLTLACSPTFAEPQALITVAPNNFSPGQNISNATTGAQLLALTQVPNPDPNFPGTTIVQYLPVYAQPVAASCNFGVPCALGGNLALGYSPTTVPSTFPILWGDINLAGQCLIPQLDCFTGGTALRVNFDVPTNYMTAAIGYFLEDLSGIQAFQAFDGNGQMIAQCLGNLGTGPIAIPPGCATVIVAEPTLGQSGWAQFTISRPTADVSFVLIGGYATDRPIAQIQFNSPVSLQLAGLVTKVKGVGPGKSLEHTVMFAQTYFAVHDVQATCAMLTGFVSEVRAQSGKKINKLTASQLLGTTQAIETAIGCQ
jgi:hypothetical protein